MSLRTQLGVHAARWSHPVRVATDPRERDAVFRLRYDVYALEHNVAERVERFGGTRMLRDPGDDDPASTIFYTGDPGAPTCTLRTRTYAPGKLPPAIREAYSLDVLPGIEERRVSEVNYLIARKSARGTLAPLALMMHATDHMVAQEKGEVLILDCAPGLQSMYHRLGVRSYGVKTIPHPGGLLIPMVGLAGDLPYYRSVDSPLYYVLRRLQRQGKLEQDVEDLAAVLRERSSVETRASVIVSELKALLADPGSLFLERLPPSTLERMGQCGYIVDIDAGAALVNQGFVEREMYLPLRGTFDVRIDDRVVATVGPGELVGEIGFVTGTGERTATVVAREDARILVVQHKFVRRSRKDHPDDAAALYEALASVMAARLVRVNRRNACLVGRRPDIGHP